MPDRHVKDPDAVLDYAVDLAGATNGTGASDWLASGETITSATVTVPTGLTLDSDSITDTDTSVTAWISGGTAGESYEVVFEFVTSAGRTDNRTIVIDCKER